MNTEPPSHGSRPTLELKPVAVSTWTAFTRNAIAFVVASAVVVVGVALSLTILAGPLLIGLIHMSSRALAGETIAVGDLAFGFRRVGRPILAWFIIMAAVSAGLILLVLPGVVLSLLWLYSFWFIANTDQLPSDALRSSWTLVRANLPSTVLLALVLVVLNVLGVFLVAGFFLSLPVSILVITASYTQLTTDESE